MNSIEIFGIQFLLSLVGFSMVAKVYVAPRIATLPLHEALLPLVCVHAFRHVGLVFLVHAVVAPTLSPVFALSAAYGDLLAGLLSLLTIFALRARWRGALALTWLFNVVGTLDLLNAFYQGIRHQVPPHLGSAWYIPTVAVPALLVSHGMIFARLARRRPERAFPRELAT